MNKLAIVGNVTADPQTRTTQDGKNVCNFNVAVNRRKKDANGNNIADFFRVSAWGAMGENCMKYLSKGKKVGVTGSVSVHPFLGQDGTPKATLEVFADDVEFLTPIGNSDRVQNSEAGVPTNMMPVEVPDGELPF